MTGNQTLSSRGACAIARIAGRTIARSLGGCCLVLAGCLGFGGEEPTTEPTTGEIGELHRMLSQRPAEPYWPQRLAEIHYASSQRDSAVWYADQALRRDADYAPALALRSCLHYERGEHAQAAAMLRAADQRRPLNDALRAGLALHLDRLEAFDEADSLFDTLPADTASSDGALLYRQLSGEGFLDSLPLARAAVERDPADASKRNNLGIALLYAGRPEEARRELLRAHELDLGLPGPLYNLAIVDRYYFFDDGASKRWLEEYLQLSSDDPDGLVELFAQADADAAQLETK